MHYNPFEMDQFTNLRVDHLFEDAERVRSADVAGGKKGWILSFFDFVREVFSGRGAKKCNGNSEIVCLCTR